MADLLYIKDIKLNQKVPSCHHFWGGTETWYSYLELPDGIIYGSIVFRLYQVTQFDRSLPEENLYYLFMIDRYTKEYELIRISEDCEAIEAEARRLQDEYRRTHFKYPHIDEEEEAEIKQKIREEAIAAGEDPEQKIKENFDNRIDWRTYMPYLENK